MMAEHWKIAVEISRGSPAWQRAELGVQTFLNSKQRGVERDEWNRCRAVSGAGCLADRSRSLDFAWLRRAGERRRISTTLAGTTS